MSEFIFKLPDLGEGTVEAEIVEWHVKPGDTVTEGDIVVDVMTDKANVEVPAPATGTVLRTTGEPGDMVAVGAELLAIGDAGGESGKGGEGAELAQAATAVEPPAPAPTPEPAPAPEPEPVPAPQPPPAASPEVQPAPAPAAERPVRAGGQILASPALRRRASEMGIDLATIQGSGPKGRILRRDLDGIEAGGSTPDPAQPPRADVEEIKVIGVRRLIAQRMQAAKQEIPHFAYVEEVDITELEHLRVTLNAQQNTASLTYLPFIALALIRSLKDFPQCNQLYDAERNLLLRHARVHLGIATQTPQGLKVPVVRDAHQQDLWQLANDISAAASAARDGSAKPDALTGSTITLTSLGKLGGIVSTPVINAPEMGIIGVNKAVHRPMIIDGAVVPRLMMNLSSSFDHRFVDGHDAASLIQAIKTQLEHPALMFVSRRAE